MNCNEFQLSQNYATRKNKHKIKINTSNISRYHSSIKKWNTILNKKFHLLNKDSIVTTIW